MDCYFVFILSGPRTSALHTGLTCNLDRRLSRLRAETAGSAAPRLLYYEVDHDAEAACRRERQLRCWSRARRRLKGPSFFRDSVRDRTAFSGSPRRAWRQAM